MKRIILLLLTLFMLSAFVFSVTSCDDDDSGASSDGASDGEDEKDKEKNEENEENENGGEQDELSPPECTHVYDHSCDASCNACGATREIHHSFDYDCDTDCGVCGFTRTAEHLFDNACDEMCNACHHTRTTEHVYSSVCATKCSVCNESRMPPHSYTADCDRNCNLCSFERMSEFDHVFSDACDYSCENCEYLREKVFHIYEFECDPDCNRCFEVREASHHWDGHPHRYDENEHYQYCRYCLTKDESTAESHTFDGACDADCNYYWCGYVREVPNHVPSEKPSYNSTSNHYYQCTVCYGVAKYEDHTYGGEYLHDDDVDDIFYEPEGHYQLCTGCGYEGTKTAHVFDNGCDVTCNSCDYEKNNPSHTYGSTKVYDYGHASVCSVCGEEYNLEDHRLYDSLPCGKRCYGCSYTESAPHTYSRMEYDENGHWTVCARCESKYDAVSHSFDNACDTRCDDCYYTRQTTHAYANACDPDCNVCGVTRAVVGHTSDELLFDDTHHYSICDECGTTYGRYEHFTSKACESKCDSCDHHRLVPESAHTYANACDRDCDVCGKTRAVPDHVYSNVCDAYCNECWAERTVPDHVLGDIQQGAAHHWYQCINCNYQTKSELHEYSGDCDTVCNACAYERVILTHYTHAYDGCTDADCNICGAEREPWDHTYSNACDTDCNQCASVREVGDHVASTYKYDYTHHWQICEICTATFNKAAHEYPSGGVVCKTCPHEYYTFGLEFDINVHSKSVIGYTGSATSIIIPSHYMGVPVSDVYSSVFQGNTSIISVTLPEREFCLSAEAFSGCTALREIKSRGTYSVGVRALEGCVSLTSIDSERITSIYSYAFSGCTALTELSFSENVDLQSAESALYECSGIQKLTLPNVSDAGRWNLISLLFYGSESDGFIKTDVDLKSFTNYSVPISLTHITLLGGDTLLDYTFCGLENLTHISISNSITVIGDHAFYGCTSLSSFEIPSNATEIGAAAFEGCTALTKLDIPKVVKTVGRYAFSGLDIPLSVPERVESVGAYAFYGCSRIERVSLLDTVSVGEYAFAYCTSLSEINIPEGWTNIPNGLLKGCTSLTSISLPLGIESIGDFAFESCSSVTSINIHRDIHYYGEKCLSGMGIQYTEHEGVRYVGLGESNHYLLLDVVDTRITSVILPSDTMYIASRAFAGTEILSSVDLGESVIGIGESIFDDCYSLTSLFVPAQLKYWEGAFAYCPSPLEVVIEEGVTVIPMSAFSHTRLVSVHIPEGVTTIKRDAFCYSYYVYRTTIQSINIPASVEFIEQTAFMETKINSLYIDDLAAWCNIEFQYHTGYASTTWSSNPIAFATNAYYYSENGSFAYEGKTYYMIYNLVIPEGVTSIPDRAFFGYEKLISVTLSGSVTEIGTRAFYGCENLTSIAFGSGIKEIGNEAFAACTSLEVVVIPEGVVSIGDEAFRGCENLKSITLPSTLTSIGTSVLAECEKLEEIVNNSSLDISNITN